MRKFAGTFVALGLVLALGAYILFVERARPPATDDDAIMLDLTGEDIARVAIEQGGRSVELARAADGKWAITSPRPLPASQSAVTALIDALTRLKCDKKVHEKVADLGPFGLDAPEVRVTVATNRRTVNVLVGSAAPVGSARYAKLGETDPVYTLGSTEASALQKTLEDLRQREVFPVAIDKVTGLRIVKAGGAELRLEKESEDRWRMIAPFEDEADRWRVSDLIWDLTALEAREFVDDDGKDLSRWGLDRPRLRADAASDDRAAPLQLFVGAPGPEGKGFYVRTSGSPSVYLVEPAAFAPLEVSPLDLVRKELAAWNDDDLLRVTCEADGKALALLKDGKSWRIVPPGQSGGGTGAGPAQIPPTGAPEVVKEGEKWALKGVDRTLSGEDMEKLWGAIRDIKVAGVAGALSGGEGESTYGLARPRARVELDLGDGEVIELKIGSRAKTGYHATVTGRDNVYLVDEEKVKALESAIAALA